MKKRNLLLSILILLVMICVAGYIFTLGSDGSEMNNDSYNNSANPQLNKSVDNISVNNTAISDNGGSVNGDLNGNYYNPSSNNERNKKDSNDSNDSYDEAMAAKKAVEKNVLDKNQIAGYPTFQDKDGSWLVPIFDKKTKKFISSVYVYIDKDSRFFVGGPQFYSEYKDVISGKTAHKVDLKYDDGDKSNVVEIVPDYSMRYVLASSNPNVLNNHEILILDRVILDNGVFSNDDQLMPVVESDCGLNSTS